MMKIRTKLLWALGSISLIPPIAAYVSLINNPRISFALRMNEYEARQGTLAQQLQSDLPRPVSCEEIIRFAATPNQSYKPAIPSQRRGALAIVTNVGTGCGGRGSVRREKCSQGGYP